MLPYSTRRYLVEYRAATDNEIASDLSFLQRAGTSPEKVGFVPRVPLWLGRISESARYTRMLSHVGSFFWSLSAGLPFHVVKLTQLMFLKSRTAPTESHTLRHVTEVGLALSLRATQVIKWPALSSPAVWIVPPWVKLESSEQKEFPLLSLVTYRDIAFALQLAAISTLTIGRDQKRRPWILQTYTAVPWFLARIALTRVDADFVIAEHFDRWAIMTDMATRAWRREGRSGRQLTLVQHGYVGSINTGGRSFIPPRKLAAVTTLYVYDSESESVFRSDILHVQAAKTAVCHRFKPAITLTPLSADGSLRVLFVGHPLCAALQIAVLEQLKGTPLTIFYKPHPLAGLPTSCEGRDWTIIKNETIFPVVDLVVSYQSTLITEYGHHRIKSIIHDLTNEIGEASQIVAKIFSSLPADPRGSSGELNS